MNTNFELIKSQAAKLQQAGSPDPLPVIQSWDNLTNEVGTSSCGLENGKMNSWNSTREFHGVYPKAASISMPLSPLSQSD